MRKLLLAGTAFGLLAAAALPAAAQKYERSMVGLERAVVVDGYRCTMTTPCDLYALCEGGIGRLSLPKCVNPTFDDKGEWRCLRPQLSRGNR